MPSPFPGMDPFLEPHWLDVHSALIAEARNALNRSLPGDLVASTEERVAVEAEEGKDYSLYPDVRIFEPPEGEARMVEAESGGTALATYRILAQVEPITERYIKVIDAGTERIITVIEFVSPTNKKGAGLFAFQSKRAELVGSGVNFVEIDLVRAGDWRALMKPHSLPESAPITPYRVSYRLPLDPGALHLTPITLQERLPEIIVPLRGSDPEVRLDLQSLLDAAYANGRYDRRRLYDKPLDPPLSDADAAWVRDLLAGRRDG